MRKVYLLSLILLLASVSFGQNRDTLTIVHYNLLNFPDGRDDCGTNIQPVNRYDTLQKILEYIQPDILMVCELHASGEALILDSCLNVNGISYYAKAAFIGNGTGDILHNMMYYNSNKVSLRSQTTIDIGTARHANEYLVYGNDPNLATHEDTTFIDLIEAHLKAGSTASNMSTRASSADSIRQYVDNFGKGVNIAGGDFNFYYDTETAYQTLCYAAGTYPYNDPINREGSWTANSAFADVHTQSTRASGTTFIECGATGGVDDRFDFLLASDSLMNTANRVHYIPGSYMALANNGTTFNKSINDATNTSSVPDSIKNALYYMSDHLPVIMKVAIEYPNPNCTDPAPTFQDSLITFSDISGSSMTVNWTQGDGSERIVVMNTTNSFTDPVDGTDPVANSVYGGSGEQVVYNGPGNSVTVTGLSASTQYWFRVYAFSCAGDSIRFNTNTAQGNPLSQTTGDCAPILEDGFSSLASWQNTADWAAINGELKHNINTTGSSYTYSDLTAQDFSTGNYEWEVCIRNGAWDPSMSNYFGYFLYSDIPNLLGSPNGYAVGVDFTKSSDELMLYRVDGGVYTSILTIPQATFDWDASEDVCIHITRSSTGIWQMFYDISGTGEIYAGSVTETTYTTGQYVGPVFNYTSGPADDLYYDDVLVCRKELIPCSDPAPVLQDSLITFSSIEGNSMTVSWTEGSGLGRVVKINTTNSFTAPTDGTEPTANTVYSGSGEQVVFNDTTGNSVTITGLSPNTEYWVRIYAFNCTGDSVKYNTNTALDNPNNTTTTCLGQLYYQNFDDAGTWTINSGAVYTSTANGVSDYSPNTERILSGTKSWQINNITGSLILNSANVAGYDSLYVRARVSTIDVPNGNGADGGDYLDFYVNMDGTGFPGTADIAINGNLNADWGYSDATGVASTTAGTPASFAPAGGEHRTSDGYSYVEIGIPDGTSTVALQVNGSNNSTNEVWCLDNIEILGCLIPPCTDPAPSTQASLITFSNVTTSSMTVHWTNGDGAGRIVVIDTSNSFTDPVDGTDPIANSVYGGGEQVVYNGTGDSVTVTGLSDSTIYWFRVYEYNCSGDSIKFNTTTATDNPLSDTTLPIVYGSCTPIFTDDFSTDLSQWQNTTDWTISSGELKHNLSGVSDTSYIYADLTAQDFSLENYEWQFCLKNGAWGPSSSNNFEFFLYSDVTDLVTGSPSGYSVGVNRNGSSDNITLYRVDNGSYTAIITGGITWTATGDNVCIRVTRSSTGDWELFNDINGGGESSVGTTSDATHTTGQYIGTSFYFTSSRAGLYYVDDVNVCSEPVPPCTDPEPTTQTSNLVFSNITETSMTVSWTNGNGAGRILIMNTISSFTDPADGNDPAADSVYSGSGEQVVYNGTGSSVTVTGLSSGSEYCFRAYEYSCDSVDINFNINTGTNNPLCDSTASPATSGCIAVQDFDETTPSWSYVTDVPFFDNGSDGFFGVHDGDGDGDPDDTGVGSGTANINYASISNDFLYVNDLNDEGDNGTADTATITFSTQNISSYIGVTLTFDYDMEGTDASDYFGYILVLDGVPQTLTEITLPGGGSTEGTVTENIPDSVSSIGLIFKIKQDGASDYGAIDNIDLCGTFSTCSDPAPTNPDSLITFSNVTGSSMDVSWTNGDGASRIVIINTINSFTDPTDGTDPVANSVYSGSGEQVIYNGTGTSVTVTGLTDSTEYWFRVYSYNCTGDSIKYNTSTATDNPNSDSTIYYTGVASKLNFRLIPSTCLEADSVFGVKVCAEDQGGILDTSYNSLVALGINSQPGGATLSGTLIKNAQSGCVVFNDISLDVIGDYTLSASDGTLSGISDTITVARSCVGQSIWEGLIINEFSNGSSGAQEYYEFVVAGQCGQAVDLRGFILDDNNGDFSTDWTQTGSGVAQGHFRFKDTPHWALVPVGSIIVIYNALDPNPSLLPDDPYDDNNDSLYIVPSNNTILFEYCSSIPQSTVDTAYSPCTYTSANDWGGLGIANGGDAVQVRSPDGTYFHGASYGGSEITGGPDSLKIDSTGGSNTVFYFNDTDYRDVTNWSSATITGTEETPGDFNNPANEAWVKSIRDASAATCPIQQPFVLELVPQKPITVKETNNDEPSVIIYPNPLNGNFLNISFVLLENTDFDIDIYDLYGKQAQHKRFHTSEISTNSSTKIDVSKLSSGIYIIRLASRDKVFYKKFQIIK